MGTLLGINVRISQLVIIAACLMMSGCASLMSSAASGLADDLSAAVLNQDDPELVRDGAPAYMLLLDSVLESSPDDPELLTAAAKMYASSFCDLYNANVATAQTEIIALALQVAEENGIPSLFFGVVEELIKDYFKVVDDFCGAWGELTGGTEPTDPCDFVG